jgi:hypothetical protein
VTVEDYCRRRQTLLFLLLHRVHALMALATRCSKGFPAESKAFDVPVGDDPVATIMPGVCLKEGTFMALGGCGVARRRGEEDTGLIMSFGVARSSLIACAPGLFRLLGLARNPKGTSIICIVLYCRGIASLYSPLAYQCPPSPLHKPRISSSPRSKVGWETSHQSDS